VTTKHYTVDPDLTGIAERQLADLEARRPDAPPKLVTTVRSDALQNLQLRATVEGHSFIADEPMAKGGHDAGPAPLRYFLGGLVMCHQVWFIKAAVRRKIEIVTLSGAISAFSGALESTSDEALGRPLSRFDYDMTVESPAAVDQVREAVEEALRFCPAMATVLQATPLRLTLTLGGEQVHARTYGGR